MVKTHKTYLLGSEIRLTKKNKEKLEGTLEYIKRTQDEHRISINGGEHSCEDFIEKIYPQYYNEPKVILEIEK